MTFGEFFCDRRRALGLTLRQFSSLNDLVPSIVSRIERDVRLPPTKASTLAKYARALRLEPGTSDWLRYHALATDASGVRSAEELRARLLEKLPAFLRTRSGKPLTEKALDSIIRILRES